jgi:hypothetical protein
MPVTPRWRMRTSDLRWVGVALIFWAIAVTYSAISRYGTSSGQYWWFCNLALAGTGWGFLFLDRGFVVGFLAIACYTQVFWIIDNLSMVFTGAPVFSLVGVIYAPDYPLDAFLLGHYHFFTIPLALLALVEMPMSKRTATWKVALFNPVIFGVSYFAFPASENINCIHRACLLTEVKALQGPWYSFLFWLSLYAMHLFIASRLDRVTQLASWKTGVLQRHLITAVQLLLVAAIGLSIWDTDLKIRLDNQAEITTAKALK